MNKNLKLSIYIQINGKVDYEIVSDSPAVHHDDCWNIDVAARKTNEVRVRVNFLESQSSLQISKVCLNSIQLNNFDLWSKYIDTTTQQSKEHTYGYIDQPGEYILKIRQNPLVHNYISYFLSLSSG
jgi:hypothetical protein